MAMHFKEYRWLVGSDLYRYTGLFNARIFVRHFLRNPGFKYSFWMRTCFYFHQNKIFRHSLFFPARLILDHYAYKYGISIPFSTRIESGLYLPHFGGIVVNGQSIIGKNCTILQGVTIGQASRGKKRGYPIIGNNVYISAGAKVIGKVTIGNNTVLGANCVITSDVPDKAIVATTPATVISYEGSEGYTDRTDYQPFPDAACENTSSIA